jgi:hypothetical protein
MENIAFDSHKRYTLCSVEDQKGRILTEQRIEHEKGAITGFLKQFAPGSPVAVETIGNWYWIVDEIEAAGMEARLVPGCAGIESSAADRDASGGLDSAGGVAG